MLLFFCFFFAPIVVFAAFVVVYGIFLVLFLVLLVSLLSDIDINVVLGAV